MSKHTPGPWTAAPLSSVVGLGIQGPGGRHIAGLGLPCQGDPAAVKQFREEQVANARLIAAAPEMLAALEQIVEWCENAQRSTNIKPYGLDIARAAIAKATA